MYPGQSCIYKVHITVTIDIIQPIIWCVGRAMYPDNAGIDKVDLVIIVHVISTTTRGKREGVVGSRNAILHIDRPRVAVSTLDPVIVVWWIETIDTIPNPKKYYGGFSMIRYDIPLKETIRDSL